MNNKVPVFLLPLLLIFATYGLSQQRTISGQTITERTTWTGNILIEGDVVVARGARLTIEPGTRVLFSPKMDKAKSGKDKTRSELIVNGILIVKGKIENKVVFSSAADQPQMGDWYGIGISNPSNRSILDFCVVEYAFNGIMIKNSNPQIRNSQVRLNYNAGILAEVKSEPIISKNIISENGYAGLITRLGAKPILSENLISLNQIGIVAFSLSQPNLGNLGNGEKYNQGRNNIFENSEYDFYNHSKRDVLAENNSWGNNSTNEINNRIFDRRDEAVYGSVDFQPVYRQASLDELLQISQNDNQPVATAPAQPQNTNNEQPVQNPESQINQPQTRPQGTAENTLAQNQPEQTNQQDDQETQTLSPPPPARDTITLENNTSPLLTRQEEKPVEEVIPQIDYNQIFLEYFLDQKKGIVLQKKVPVIRAPQMGLGAKGRIIVRAVIDREGKVQSASVIKGLNLYFDKISLDAARQFRYVVGTVKGVPVRFYTNIIFEF